MASNFEDELRDLLSMYLDYFEDPEDPDYILACYLQQCIETFNIIMKKDK